MLTVELFIAPLRLLITALGTGELTPGNPADTVRQTTANLERTRQRSETAMREAADGWDGRGGGDAREATTSNHRRLATLADDGSEFSRLVEEAGARVKVASAQLNALVDSFERSASALGPQLFSPAGFGAILPVAIEHVARGLQIVGRTQHELQGDTARMMGLAKRIAPARVTPNRTPPAGTAESTPGRVPITLPDGSIAYAPNERAAKAVRAALSQRGVRYKWGGTTPAGFDCSGFTQWAYRQAGLELPRLAQEQDTAGVAVSQADLQPGDLAVWSGHVAMYIGNGQLVEAGDPVGVSPVRTTNAGQAFEGFYRPR